MKSVRDATEETIRQLKNFQDRPFWVYMGMLGILVFVRLTFYIFHLMFPTYAIRVFGADFPVASIFGTLNPVMIIFLVPLISALTINVRSYTMLLWGTGLSAASVFLCFLPESLWPSQTHPLVLGCSIIGWKAPSWKPRSICYLIGNFHYGFHCWRSDLVSAFDTILSGDCTRVKRVLILL